MEFLHIVGLLLGGVLAAASLIVSKKPEAEKLIAKLRPYQAIVGVSLLVLGVLYVLDGALGVAFRVMEYSLLAGLTFLGVIVCEFLLGIMLGAGYALSKAPDNDFKTKSLEVQRKLFAKQVPIGIAGLVFAFLLLLYRLEILTVF